VNYRWSVNCGGGGQGSLQVPSNKVTDQLDACFDSTVQLTLEMGMLVVRLLNGGIKKFQILCLFPWMGKYYLDYLERVGRGLVLPEFVNRHKQYANRAHRCNLADQVRLQNPRGVPVWRDGVGAVYIEVERLTFTDCKQVFYSHKGRTYIRNLTEQRAWLVAQKNKPLSRLVTTPAPSGVEVRLVSYNGVMINQTIDVGRAESNGLSRELTAIGV